MSDAKHRTATSLLADNQGDVSCFYCGSPADVPLKLSSSFVEWWSVSQPESDHICRGCEVALREKIDIPGKDKPQKTRNYSWLVTTDSATPYTKANKTELARILLSPPDPPWAMALADSGQKHLLYRTPVNRQDTLYRVQLEMRTVLYTVESLRDRLDLTRRIVAAIGHKGAKLPGVGLAIAADDASLLEEWLEVEEQSLSALALFLTPSQKECKSHGNQDS